MSTPRTKVRILNHWDNLDRSVERDIESRTLARAVKYHCEYRVLLNGRKTVIFG